MTIENAKKHDYFSLGSTLFSLKYGKYLFILPRALYKNRQEKRIEIVDYIYKKTMEGVNDEWFGKFCDVKQISY